MVPQEQPKRRRGKMKDRETRIWESVLPYKPFRSGSGCTPSIPHVEGKVLPRLIL